MKHTLKWLLLLLALAGPAGAQTIAGAAGNLLVSCNAITASTSANPGTSAGCLAIAMPSPNGQLPAAFTWQTLTTGGPASVAVNFVGSLDGTTWSQLDTSTNTSGEIRSVSGKPMRFVGCVPATLTGGTAPTITCQLTVTTAGTGGGGTGAGAFVSASPPGTGYQDVTEIAAPANPAAGVDRIYSDIVAHTIKCLTSGGGSCLTTGGSLPTATVKGQVPVSTGAGTTYAAQNKLLADEQDYTGATGCDIINNLAAANPFQKVSAEALTGSIYNCANVNLDNPFNTIQLNGGNIFTTDTGWTWGNRQVVNGNVGNIGATAVTSGTQFRTSANFPLGSTPGTLTATGSSGAGTVSLTRTGTALQVAPYDTLVFAGDATIYYVKKCTAATDPPCADTTGGGAGASDWYNLTGTITVNITPVLASSPSGAATTLTSAVVEFGDIQGGSPSGEKLESAFISCALATGNGIGVRDNYAQENSDARNVWVNNCGRGFWVPSAANSGDWSNLNVGYTADANCTTPTIPFEVSGAHKKFSRATITTQSCTATKLTKGIFHITNAQIGGVSAPGGLVLDQVHGEAQGPSNSVDMILVDSANPSPAGNTGAVEIPGASGCPSGNPCLNLLHVASNFAGTLHLHDSTCNNGTTNAVVDDINANTMTCANNSIGLGEYRMDATGHIFTNLNSANMTKGTNLYNGVLGFYTSNTLNASISEAGLITGKGVSLGSGPPSCGTGVTGAFCLGEAATTFTTAAGMDACRADTSHLFKCTLNNGAEFTSLMNVTDSAHGLSSILTCTAASASGTAYTCSTSPTFTPADGDVILFQADVANTGSATLNVNASSAATIKKQGGGTNLVANDLLAGQDTLLEYDGTNWQMQGQTGNSAAGGVTSVSGDGVLITNSGSTGAVTLTLGKSPVGTDTGIATAATISTTAGTPVCATANGGVTTTACPVKNALTNTTAVTQSNPTINVDALLMDIPLGAGYLNTAGAPFLISGSGLLSSTIATTPQVTITAKLCSVSGCGSGTVTPLAAIQSSALNTTAITNATWLYDLKATTVGTGASCNLIVKGSLLIETGANVASADSSFADSNAAVSSPNQNCANALFLDFFVQQTVAGASNSYKQLSGIIGTLGGSGGAGGTTSQYAWWSPAATSTTGVGNVTLNTTKIWGFVLPLNITSSTGVCYDVITADNSTNVYDLGVYDTAGNLIVHTGATAGTTLFPGTSMRCATWTGGGATIVAGRSYFAMTTGTTATAVLGGSTVIAQFASSVTATGGTTSGGVLNNSITPPADTWAIGSMIAFNLH